jgi:hypothetical protein
VVEAVSDELASPVIGVHGQTRTLHALLRSPDPGAWVRAAATRDIILHPLPPYAAVALGADALRSVATRAGRALGAGDGLRRGRDTEPFPLVEALTPIGRALLEAVDMRTITATLGFDPRATLARWLGRSPSSATDDGAEDDAIPDEDT